MKRSNRLLILLGLLIAISASLAAAAYVSSGGGGGTSNAEASASPTPEPTVEVVAAAIDIPAGTQITAGMLTMKTLTITERDAFGSDTFDKIDRVVDRMAGSDITKDQVIVASKDLMAPGSYLDGKSLRDSIRPGMVAISMEVDQVNGVGTIIVPGDHVDVILSVWVTQMSLTWKDASGTGSFTGGTEVTTKMVIQDCRVLATLLPPAAATPNQTVAPAAAGSGPTATPGSSSATVQFTGRHMIVVIEVIPDEAEVIRWAQRAEKTDTQNYIDLALVLRSTKDDTDTRDTSCDGAPCIKTTGVNFRVLVEKYKVLPPDPSWTLPDGLRAKVQW